MTALADTAEAPPGSTWGAVARALRVAPALRRGLGLTLLLALAGTSVQIVVPIVMQRMVDDEILAQGGVDIAGVLALGGAAVALMILGALAGRLALRRLGTSSATGLADLRVLTFRHLQRLSILHMQSQRRGALVSRVTSDVETIQDFMEWGGVGMLIGSAQVALTLVVMFLYDWRLALLVLAAVTIYALMLLWFQKILAKAHDRVRERVADTLSAIGESISGLLVVRAYGAEEQTRQRVREALRNQYDAEYRTARLGATLFSSAELFAGLVTAAVIALGVIGGAASGTTAGTLIAFLFLLNLLVEPVQLLVEALDLAQTAGAGLRRILGLLDTPADIADPVDGIELPDGPLDVRFDHVRYQYPDGAEDVLADVSVQLAAGRRVAVVGETGSGKTTFAKLVTRLIDPVEGRVLVGGVPVDNVRFSSLRTRVAFVPQEGFLFDTTVGENVRYGRLGSGDDGIRAAFYDLGLGDWLATLPAGLDTPVGERGGRLSAGERQLVALVRAWIADPDLLVLDEATSAVDPALEVSLRRAIERLTAGRTSVTVAHRLSTAEAADEVLVFDDGQLVERGSHIELLAKGGVYAALHADWAAGAASVA